VALKPKNTKTEEDVDKPGLVPIIKPLRLLLDAIKPARVSGCDIQGPTVMLSSPGA
jgi:hypothetical protein